VDQTITKPNAQENNSVQGIPIAVLQLYMRVLNKLEVNTMEKNAMLSLNCSTRRSPPRSQRRKLLAETSPRTVGVDQDSTKPDALEDIAQNGHGVVTQMLTRKINKLMVDTVP